MKETQNRQLLWQPLTNELERWARAGQVAKLWLRDDDATEPTLQLEKFASQAERYNVPYALAVIPVPAKQSLGMWAQKHPLCSIALHGICHQNHAEKNKKKCELGRDRPLKKTLKELSDGHNKLAAMFGEQYLKMLVPPWNRIDEQLIGHLPQLGLQSLSTFADAHQTLSVPGLKVLNTHVDIVDWKAGRVGKPINLVIKDLAEKLRKARQTGFKPVGILTHHLVHDDVANAFLPAFFQYVACTPNIKWMPVSNLVK